MLKKREEAFETVQPLFRAAETSVDLAAMDTTGCIAQMLKVRARANLALSIGTDIFDKLVAALAANVAARGLFIEAHALTPAVGEERGLERMFGDESLCPKIEIVKGAGDVVPIGHAA